jgi:all-trans-retinol 13,14-reductase
VKDGKAVGVRTQTGEEFFASKIISAVGVKNTVTQLIPEEYKTTPWGKELTSLGQSPSYICLNLGFEGDILAAGATVSNQWFFESWSMEANEWDLEDPQSTIPIIYLSFPSLKDPHHNAGLNLRQTGEAVTFVPWKSFEKWKQTRRGKRDTDYLEFKKEIENRIILQLKKHIPKLMEMVVYHELSTPLSTSFFTRAPQGAIYGLEATPRRFTSSHLRTRTPIRNLYLTGGDVATLGVTGAMIGGVLTAGTIKPQVFTHLIEIPKFLKFKNLDSHNLNEGQVQG